MEGGAIPKACLRGTPTCQKASYRDSPVTAKMPKPPIHTSARVRYSSDSTLLKLQ